VLHLARGGWLRLRARPTSSRPALRGPLALSVTFENGVALEVTEQGTEKRLALYLVRDPSEVPGIARLGIDALDPALTEERLGVLLAGATGTVKSVLADQGVVAGVGNAYSDEILHSARLSPFRKAAALEATEVALLHAAMRSVLSEAVAAAGAGDVATLKDAKRMTMRVHGRGGGRCPVCGDVIRDVWFSSRSFQYCPGCQTGGRVYADRRMSRLLR
jgi:formamidopyrimidine-DNA glycosylase